MTTLVVGASGATGKELVRHLLDQGQNVKVIVRSIEKVPDTWKNLDDLCILEGSLLDIPKKEIEEYVKGCDAIASCLGHNLSFKGIYGKPRKLVRDSVQLLCNAVEVNRAEKPVKFVLMNTTGNRNKDLNEKISLGEKLVLGIIRVLLPPQSDNEQAAEFLRTGIGQNNTFVEWVTVRPDSLFNEDDISKYSLHPSPIRSAIFNAGKTSRTNVGHFMASLITNNELWEEWKGQMPVIYNEEVKK